MLKTYKDILFWIYVSVWASTILIVYSITFNDKLCENINSIFTMVFAFGIVFPYFTIEKVRIFFDKNLK